MKKILLLFVFVASAILSNAQDVIITKDSERIKAQISEISDREVKFKRLDNLNGPLFILPAQKVASIVFANGDVFVFNERIQKPVQSDAENDNAQEDKVSSQLVETLISSDNNINISHETLVHFVGSDEATKAAQKGDKGAYGFFIGGQKLKDKEYKKLTKDSCPEAYKLYKKAKDLDNVGLGVSIPLFASGLALMCYPLITLAPGIPDMDTKNMILCYSGAGVLCLTPIFILTSVSKKTELLKIQSVNIYNQQCQDKKVTSSLSFGLTPNGVGLVLSF